ncbi:MAG: DUF2344 domain-containing protein [Candidatus Syntrophonatronum acetioxidans]|uniref:DUF2344 domain-containing protein n=1 Tax=Candidatus Syntrophonatronum acetioxidans TaxID=1795816 RepID=A0A424YIH0_9FIRM|nr:MAG: DUF2344 domain-containing protein [Candidatus Syntrophonatronum acetioxidans]
MSVKFRLLFSKGEELKYISHLDLLRLFFRAFRRAGINLKFKGKFNPQPKISYALALPLGSTSSGEYLEVELEEDMDTGQLKNRLSRQFPPGIDLREVKEVAGKGPSLTSRVKSVHYRVKIEVSPETEPRKMSEIIENILKKKELWFTRKKKKTKKDINLRPFINNMELVSWEGQKGEIKMELKATPRGSVKPVEIMEIIEREALIDLQGRNIHRELIELELEE